MKYRAVVVTVSDKGSRGERVDGSGPALKGLLEGTYEVAEIIIVPDEKEIIAETMCRLADVEGADLVVTTGGTGLGPRDVTPEATRAVIDKDLPGFAEAMRMESFKITPHGIISRGICGTRKSTIIINLPGSPKAATECLSFILPALPHALSKLKGDPADCATE